MRMKCLTVSSALALVASAHASFTVIKGIDNWNAAVGPCTTLDFVFPTPQIMGDQYASVGAVFPEGNEFAYLEDDPDLFQQDGWGCTAYDGGIDITFLWPQYAIGAWFPGDLKVKLYWQDQLIYTSPALGTPLVDYQYGGVLSSQPFDRIVFYDAGVFVDDILFVPGPGAVGLLALAGAAAGRRRRDA